MTMEMTTSMAGFNVGIMWKVVFKCSDKYVSAAYVGDNFTEWFDGRFDLDDDDIFEIDSTQTISSHVLVIMANTAGMMTFIKTMEWMGDYTAVRNVPIIDIGPTEIIFLCAKVKEMSKPLGDMSRELRTVNMVGLIEQARMMSSVRFTIRSPIR